LRDGNREMQGAVPMSLILKSSAFGEEKRIPTRHTCDGQDLSPPLSWSNAPPDTKSFALICSDPDAPMKTWYHWAIFDIPATVDHLDEGVAKGARVDGWRQAVTDFGRAGYGGPCPPKGHGEHHYRFHLLALRVATLAVPGKAHCRDIERAAASHIVGEAVLIGTYSR
jgi:Raf kinase inhibitor-like YbhB/YbcL family protein